MDSHESHVVILGAGHAGGSAAALLRQHGHRGRITLIGEETVLPYQRPPLSKAWLKGEVTTDHLTLKSAKYYADNNIAVRLGVCALSLDRMAKKVTLSDNSEIAYDRLVMATGARPVIPPIDGTDLEGVFYLRGLSDAAKLRAFLGPGKRLAIIGGGYIGLEVAASAIAMNAETVVVERESRLLARVASETLAAFFQRYHEKHNVQFLLGAAVSKIVADGDRVAGIRLSDGREMPCDAVLIGVGVIPNDELASGAGLETSRGVVVDLNARTADPCVYAIGDVTCRPLPHYDNRLFHLESVPNALEQARQAVAAILGRIGPTSEVPWFWSDQYDVKLQIAGIAFSVEQVVVRGDLLNHRFAIFHLRNGRVQAVEAINAPQEFMVGRKLIESQSPVNIGKLGDISITMKDIAGG